MKTETTIRVRYNECDSMGVVHHAVYPVWFEIGRTELLRVQGKTYRSLEQQGVYLVVSDLVIKYKKPAKYDDELILETEVSHYSPARITHSYELRNEDSIIATAQTVLACVDCEGRVQRVPEYLCKKNER